MIWVNHFESVSLMKMIMLVFACPYNMSWEANMADKPKRGFYFTDQLAQKLESPLDQSVYVNVQASFHPTLTSVLELPRDEYGWVAIPHARDHSFQTDRTRVLRGVRRFLKTVGHGDVT